MKRTILIIGCIVLAVLVGRYLIPSGRSNGGNHSVSYSPASAPSPSPSSPSSPPPSSGGGVTISEHPPVTVSDQDPESDIDARVAAPSVQPAGQTVAARNGTGVFINGRELTRDQAIAMARLYHYPPVPGRYWYDARSGAWGLEGHETIGFLLPGHDFGPMSPDASRGDTGVFINGREINMIEAARIQQTFGAVYRGRWWLDGRTGYYGVEGNPMPVGNITAALQSQRSGRSGDNFWCSATACGNDNGQSGYVSVDGYTVGYDH